MTWGARAADWLASEQQHLPIYEEALARTGLDPGDQVLDVGCGAGVFLGLVAERGGVPHGIDNAPELLDLARGRLPGADLRDAEMTSLPHTESSFDLVTGFTSFFLAADIVATLREAARVAKPGAPVFIQAWGNPERCELEPMKRIARPFMPPPPATGRTHEPLWKPVVLENLAREAGLEPRDAFDFAFPYEYADGKSLGRLLMAPMGVGALIGPDREPEVRAEIVSAGAPFRAADGSYRVNNEYRCLIARAS
jgi:SAM-dependent methyltransferase